jgi:hypothetical protein
VLFNLLGLDPTSVVTEATQFDTSRMTAPFSAPLPGKLAPWERPLVTVAEILDDIQIDTQPTVRSAKKAIFGPEL